MLSTLWNNALILLLFFHICKSCKITNLPDFFLLNPSSFSLFFCFSVTHSFLTLCEPMDWSMPGFPALHHLPELAQTHVHWASDVIQPTHPLLWPSRPAFYLSQHGGPFQWVSSLHQVAKVMEFQLQHQSSQWTLRTDFL